MRPTDVYVDWIVVTDQGSDGASVHGFLYQDSAEKAYKTLVEQGEQEVYLCKVTRRNS